jgi:hypothetical protein
LHFLFEQQTFFLGGLVVNVSFGLTSSNSCLHLGQAYPLGIGLCGNIPKCNVVVMLLNSSKDFGFFAIFFLING